MVNMKKILILLSVAIVLFGLAYTFIRIVERHTRFSDGYSTAQSEGVFGQLSTLALGSAFLYKDGLIVSLDEVNDSRCPKETQCVWAGELQATFHVSGGLIAEAQDITLALEADGTGSRRATTTIDGYIFSLDAVTVTKKVRGSATFLVDFAPKKVVEAPVEDAGNAPEKKDLIRVTNISTHDTLQSPVTVMGEARGTWYFEASFPVELLDAEDNVLAQGTAQAQSDWMTENFVPFHITLTFVPPASGTTGTLVLRKDNPSGDPLRDDALLIPIQF